MWGTRDWGKVKELSKGGEFWGGEFWKVEGSRGWRVLE
jgi:hypothetical protein